MIRISIGIVTHNSKEVISDVLDSIKECNIKNLDIYVLDNNSNDGTIDLIRNNYDFVEIIESKENLGYGKGHNRILEKVDSDYHIIVNPDIILKREELQKMIDYMEENKEVAILTPKVLNIDGTEQFLPKKTPRIKYLLGRYENKFSICKKWRDEYTLRNENITNPIEIDFCTGCFMFCRTSMLKQINGFDERYFMYFEDVDLTREIQKIGKTIYNPKISVIHKWNREDAKDNKLKNEHIKSMFKYLLKWK